MPPGGSWADRDGVLRGLSLLLPSRLGRGLFCSQVDAPALFGINVQGSLWHEEFLDVLYDGDGHNYIQGFVKVDMEDELHASSFAW